MRLFVVAGEASGDLHGARLLAAIRALEPGCVFEGFGGERMAAEGMTVLRGLRHLAFMGFSEVLKKLPTVLRNFSIAKQAMTERRPDALLLIDYPGFNLRMAKWAKRHGIPVLYYIAPQVWAWKESRIKGMKQHIDRLMVILPFEKDYFAKHGMEVDFVGHPLLDGIRHQISDIRDQKVIALLPGSREQEVRTMLPAMLAVRERFPEYRFVVGKAPGLSEDFYRGLIAGVDAEIFTEGTQVLLSMADAALVASGTATLETALMGVPQVVCYRGNGLSVLLARKLIKVPYIALVNLILDRAAVTELIQNDLTPDRITARLQQLLRSRLEAETIRRELFSVLGGAGASERAAQIVVRTLKE